ncbi:MAG: YhfC family intramembrane metalloprotease [Ardenticatenaceae bacterium]|nr:YhfC family intramembrane metalloprotease [Ardenticatenaceae bacterium]
MITLLLTLNFLLMIVVPIVLARKIAVTQRVGWELFGIGAVAFVLSQVGHLPFNWYVLQQSGWLEDSSLLVLSLFLGLSAGTFEGVARYLSLRFWARRARSWRQGLMVGMGHGGIEAILLGVLGLINFVILFGLKEGHFQGILATVPAEQLPLVDQQIEALFSVSPSMAVQGALERVFVLMVHLAATLLVLQALVRQKLRWLAAGILWHALVDGALVYVVSVWGGIMAETVLGVLSLLSLGIVFGLRVPEPEEVVQPLPALAPLKALDVSVHSLEKSKYSN